MEICGSHIGESFESSQQVVHWCWKMTPGGDRFLGYAPTPDGEAMVVCANQEELIPLMENASKAQPDVTFVLDQGRLIDAIMISETGLVAVIGDDCVKVAGIPLG